MDSGATFDPPSFDLAYVISDLHIGGEEDFQIFASAPQFTDFINHILANRGTNRVLLVINGDFVDFLAEPDAIPFNLNRAPQMLKDIFERPQFSNVKTALQKYVKAPRTHLVITLGNHDVELALPTTSRTLTELLTNSEPSLEGKVQFVFDGRGYRFRVGDCSAVCLHGNETDNYNFTRYDELNRIIDELTNQLQSPFGATWEPSGGSWFVIKAVNPIKKAYPFVDMLKPEFSLMAPVLAMLDPGAAAKLANAGKMSLTAIKNRLMRPESERQMLNVPISAGELAFRGKLPQTVIEDLVEDYLASGRIDELIHQPAAQQMLFFSEILERVNQGIEKALDTAGAIEDSVVATVSDPQMAAFKWTIGALLPDKPFNPDALDSADIDINGRVLRKYSVVFAGHTHFRRIKERPNGVEGIYVNTGTWANLMTLTSDQFDDPQRFRTIYQALRSGSRPRMDDAGLIMQQCTVARMAPNDAGEIVVELCGVAKNKGNDCLEPLKIEDKDYRKVAKPIAKNG